MSALCNWPECQRSYLGGETAPGCVQPFGSCAGRALDPDGNIRDDAAAATAGEEDR